MIFYILLLGLATILDIKEIKNGSKSDMIFFTVSIILVLIWGTFYFIKGQGLGIAEYIISNMEGF